LSQRVGISRQEARKVIDDYYATYKGVRRYMDEIPVQAREHGYVRSLYDAYGRCRASMIATPTFAAQPNAKASTCQSRHGQRHREDCHAARR